MSDRFSKRNEFKQLDELLGALCNETITPDQHAQLADLLAVDPKARSRYLEYLLVHVKLRESALVGIHVEEADQEHESEDATHEVVIKRHRYGLTRHWAMAVAVCLGGLVCGGYLLSRTEEEPSAVVAESPALDQPSVPLYLAQISGMTPDVQWDPASEPSDFLLRFRRGDRLKLESGLVEIDYFSSGSLILHGPCEFVLTGESSGRLEKGQLTGNVSQGDFTLTTPTAEVIDLGTEFGVSVDSIRSTDVCVFDGTVRVSGGATVAGLEDSRLLQKGMAVRVSEGGQIARFAESEPERFVRRLPSSVLKANEISLVNILSGWRRDQFRLAGVIAPDTGESDSHPWLRVDGPGYSKSRGFQTTSWHPFVDGVFIPPAMGGKTQLDSGNHFVDLPSSTGRTWGPIWSRRKIEGVTTLSSQEDYWGTDTLGGVIDRLKKTKVGLIGVHSNVGITFDLSAIRKQWGREPVEFSTIVSNLEISMERIPEWAALRRFSADFRILVDGEPREARFDFTRADGEVEMKTKLRLKDRFLTLISMDAGKDEPYDHDAYDHVVLVDPVLVLEP